MNKQRGYIAIASMLVIAAVVTLIGITVALSSINEAQVSLSSVDGDQSLDLTEGCAADALLYLNNNNLLPSTVTTPLGSCDIVLESQLGQIWTFIARGVSSNHAKKVRIQADRSSTISIISWQEVE